MRQLFIILALLGGLIATRAQTPDDQYLHIFNLIQEGDASSREQQPAYALSRYREAYAALKSFQRGYPQWNEKVVAFRLSYLAGRITALSAATPAEAVATNAPAQPATPPAPAPDLRQQLASLEDQVRQLQGDKSVLEAKLKEALSLQPAAVDPRELAQAEQKIRELQKENDLLKVGMDEAKAQAKASGDTRNQETLNALRAENEILKKQLASSKSPGETGAAAAAAELARTQALLAVLQSEKETLRLEKLALETRVKQILSTNAPAAVVTAPPPEVDRKRVRQLEEERDDLRKKLEAANRKLEKRRSSESKSRAQQLEEEVAALRLRIEVLEARKVPYTPEELALFSGAGPQLAEAKPAARESKTPPPGTTALVAEAQRLFVSRDFTGAEEIYKKVLSQDEKNLTSLANLAAIQLQAGKLEEAERNLKAALAINPDHVHSLSTFGLLKFQQKQYDAALDALSRAAKAEPENAQIQNRLGLVLSEKGLRGPSETAFRKAIQLEPGFGEAHHNLAVVYATQQPPLVELARWHYQRGLSAGMPKNPRIEAMLEKKAASTEKQ